ncbi:MAG: hypothetical protein WAN61_03525 [Minisyncoccia bacterium]
MDNKPWHKHHSIEGQGNKPAKPENKVEKYDNAFRRKYLLRCYNLTDTQGGLEKEEEEYEKAYFMDRKEFLKLQMEESRIFYEYRLQRLPETERKSLENSIPFFPTDTKQKFEESANLSIAELQAKLEKLNKIEQ